MDYHPPTFDTERERDLTVKGGSLSSSKSNSALAPLIVDLDGTLTPTDTLIESIVQMLKRDPLAILRLPFWIIKGRAAFKEIVALRSNLSIEYLPYRIELLDYLRKEREKGRCLILATAANRKIADAIATYLGLFDQILASDGAQNLKGVAKLKAIQVVVGDKFVYAGDNASDLPIWKSAEAAILVGVPSNVASAIRHDTPIEKEFPRENFRITIWLRALRVHQWMKNLLLFVPLLTAFSFLEGSKIVTMAMAFFAFCLAASATYLVNDLWDLENDRVHPQKRYRPFASAQISIMRGVAMAVAMLGVALLIALAVTQGFFLMLMLYLMITTLYSWVLKEYVLIDVLTLSFLYTLRILAGSVAVDIKISSWLLTFSVFIFFSLALVKRCSELVSLEMLGRDATRGRDYRVTDLIILWPLGAGSALCAVVVFGLFINAGTTQARYASPQLLWVVAIGLIYWLSRLWIKTARGEMHDDPLIFAVQDFGSRIAILAIVFTILVAHFIIIG